MHRYLCVDNTICHKEYLIMVNVLFFFCSIWYVINRFSHYITLLWPFFLLVSSKCKEIFMNNLPQSEKKRRRHVVEKSAHQIWGSVTSRSRTRTRVRLIDSEPRHFSLSLVLYQWSVASSSVLPCWFRLYSLNSQFSPQQPWGERGPTVWRQERQKKNKEEAYLTYNL